MKNVVVVDVDSCTFLGQHRPVKKCSVVVVNQEKSCLVDGCLFLGPQQAALFITPPFYAQCIFKTSQVYYLLFDNNKTDTNKLQVSIYKDGQFYRIEFGCSRTQSI